jgi:hypothetical protein
VADEAVSGFLPSAALLKAVLVNSATGVDTVEEKPAFRQVAHLLIDAVS